MIRKKIAAILSILMLTACGINSGEVANGEKKNIRNKEITADSKNGKGEIESDKDERESKEGSSEEGSATSEIDEHANSKPDKGETGQASQESSHGASQESKQSKDASKTDESDSKIDSGQAEENRLSIDDIFEGNIGETYRHTGPLDYERIEKMVGFGYRKNLDGMFYHFQGYDNSDMKDGTKRYYSYNYNVNEERIVLNTGKVSVPIFNKQAAERGETWTGEFQTNIWEVFQAEFKVVLWDENTIKVEVVPSDKGSDEKFNNYKEVYTYERGRGNTDIFIEQPFKDGGFYPFGITIDQLNSEEMKELNKNRWPEMDEKYVQEDRILKGYYDISDEYYNQLKTGLKKHINENQIQGEAGEKILLDFYRKMPDDSMRAMKYIDDLACIMEEESGDSYYRFMAAKEYERRIDAMNDIYEDDKVMMPVIDNYSDFLWSKNIIIIEDRINDNLEGADKRRIDIYLQNHIRPVNYKDDQFARAGTFFEEALMEDDSEEVKNYFTYKRYSCHTADDRYNHAQAESMLKSLRYMEARLEKGDNRFEGFMDDLSKELIQSNWESYRLQIKILKEYLKELPSGKYAEEAAEKLDYLEKNMDIMSGTLKEMKSKFKALYNSEPDEYQCTTMWETYLRDEMISRLDDNRKELEEIPADNVVEVWNEFELINAVKDDAVIKVMDNICFAVNREWSFEGVKNVTIFGDEEDLVTLYKYDSNAIIRIKNCENITIRNVCIGSRSKAASLVDVRGSDSSNINIENCVFFGDGSTGIRCDNVQKLSVLNSLLGDSLSKAMELEKVYGVNIDNIIMTENTNNEIIMNECTNIKHNNVNIEKLEEFS